MFSRCEDRKLFKDVGIRLVDNSRKSFEKLVRSVHRASLTTLDVRRSFSASLISPQVVNASVQRFSRELTLKLECSFELRNEVLSVSWLPCDAV